LDALYADDEDGTLVAEGLSDAEGLASLKVREYGQIRYVLAVPRRDDLIDLA